MTTRSPRHLAGAGRWTALASAGWTWLVLGAATSALLAVTLPDAGWARAVVAVVLAVTLVAVALRDRALGILATTGFLAVLGLVRRLVSMVQADPDADPLLLVAPLVAGVLATLAVRAGGLRRPSPLTIGAGLFFGISVAAVANPTFSQTANLQGALFWSVPLLWFPVGRALVDDALLGRLLRLVTGLGLAACLTGIYQATVGLPIWDERWVADRGYQALGVNGLQTLRPFGWSASSSEFALTAAVVMVLCGLQLADGVRERSARLTLLFGGGVAVAAGALILSAVRTAVLLGLVSAVVVAVASRKARVGRVVVGLALAVVALVGGVRLLDVESWDDQGIPGLLRRSTLGFTDPFDPAKSTLGTHIELTQQAFETLDERPLGGGTAFGTTADDESGNRAEGAENDLGNAALAFGIPGVLLVLGITALGLRAAWRAVGVRPTLLTLGALGLLVASLRFWWTGGHYAMAALAWLALGWTDRRAAE